MKKTGTILKELRKKSNLSVQDVLVKLKSYGEEIQAPTLYAYENNTRAASADMLLALCQIYKCNNILETFASIETDYSIPDDTEWEIIEKYRSLDSFGRDTISLILDREAERVKSITEEISEKEQYIADMKSKSANIVEFRPSTDNCSDERMTNYYHSASAGSGIFIMGNESTEQIAIPNTPENANVDYAIKVSGDSMEPGFSDGDIVLVSQKAELYCGDIGIFIINGKAYIKEYAEIELISTNPNADNIKISEFDNIVCMGKVVGKLDHLQNHLSHEDEVAIREANNLLNKKKLKKKES